MNLLWWIYYSCLALSCPMPIVETLWITGDRRETELERLISVIFPQLTARGFVFSSPEKLELTLPNRRDCRSCETDRGQFPGFFVVRGNVPAVFHFFIGVPVNDYCIAFTRTPESDGYLEPFGPGTGSLDRIRWLQILLYWLSAKPASMPVFAAAYNALLGKSS